MRDYWCRKRRGDCLNETAKIVNAIQIDRKKEKNFFCKSMFYCSLPNGGKKKKNWLCFPQVQAKHFASIESCFHLKIVLSREVASAKRMVAHESSKAHRDATMTLYRRAKVSGRVNSLLIDQCQAERVYAKAVLHGVVATIKFLAEEDSLLSTLE